VLVMLFSKGITSRLDVLTNNADRLATGRELNAVVPGHDEITQLDIVMHDVVSNLRKAEQRKQDFLSMISHDLRSPLTALQANLSLIAKQPAIPDDTQQRVVRGKRSIARMIELISQLLDFEKIEAGMLNIHKEACDLKPILESAIESVKDLALDRNIEIECAANSLDIMADKQRLTQVLTNLLANAIQHSPVRGHISIAVEDKPQSVRVSVQDNGTGIDKEAQSQIFDRFVQVHSDDVRTSQGTGLGLPICKALVEAHGGTIGVISEVGAGSSFWFTIPKPR
jgi:signal transduction histidine kinase